MAQKPIQRKDLLANDALTSVVKEAIELEEKLTEILNINKQLVKSNPLKSGKDVKQYKEDVESVAKTTKALNQVTEQLNKSTDKEVAGRLRLQRATKKQRDELKDLIVLEDREAGTLERLQAKSRQLRREREKLNLDTANGVKRLKEINVQLDVNNKQIKENSDALKQQRLNVGNYKDSVKEALSETNAFGVSFTSLSDSIASFANPLTGVLAGLGALGGLYASSTSGAKDLRNAQTQLNTAYSGFAEELAVIVGADGKGGGLLGSFTNTIIRTFGGAGAALQSELAGDAVEALDQLRVAQAEADRDARRLFRDAEKIRNVRDDELKSVQERVEANDKLYKLFNEREKIQVSVLQSQLNQTIKLLALDENNVDLQIEKLRLEEEIFDVQEENEGFRAEALSNTNSLRREENALIKETSNSYKELSDELADEDNTKDALSSIAAVSKKIEEENKSIIEDNEQEAKDSIDRLLEYKEKAFAEETDAAIREDERKRRALEQARQDTIRKAQDSLAILANLISVFNASGANTGGSGDIISSLSGLIAGSFYEGTEKVADSLGKPVFKGKDGYVVRVDGSERVLTGSQNSKIGAISNEDLANIAFKYRTGNLSSSSPINDDKVVSKLSSIEKTIKDSQTILNIDKDGIVTTTQFNNGLKKVSKKLPRRIK